MRIPLEELFEGGKHIRRASWPAGDFLCADGAEEGTLWYYTSEADDFAHEYKLGFHDLGPSDWEVMP